MWAAVPLFLLSSVASFGTPPDAKTIRDKLEQAQKPGWTMHAVRIGTTHKADRATFIRDRSLGEHVDIAFAFWVLQGFERVVLIDTGFVDPRYIKSWRVKDYRDPERGLALLDLEPTEVTDIILTHHHFDHIGGVVLFPSARLWTTDKTFRAGMAWAKKNDEKLWHALQKAQKEARVEITEPLQQVAPHVVVVPVGLHTQGFQYVVVNNHDGIWVFASDIAPLRENLERRRSTGLTTNARQTVQVTDTLLQLVDGNIDRIITGHHAGGFDAQGLIQLSVAIDE